MHIVLPLTHDRNQSLIIYFTQLLTCVSFMFGSILSLLDSVPLQVIKKVPTSVKVLYKLFAQG